PEGPADLRLVPPALAVWGAAAISLGLPGRWVTDEFKRIKGKLANPGGETTWTPFPRPGPAR
ncbi:hypothetical protein ACWD6Z_15370, partial [Streptomyces californicus]